MMSFDAIIGAVLGSLFVLLILVILICGVILIKNRRKKQLRSIGKGIHIAIVCAVKYLVILPI